MARGVLSTSSSTYSLGAHTKAHDRVDAAGLQLEDVAHGDADRLEFLDLVERNHLERLVERLVVLLVGVGLFLANDHTHRRGLVGTGSGGSGGRGRHGRLATRRPRE